MFLEVSIEVFGHKTGLAPSALKVLERIYRRRVPPEVVASPELARSLVEASNVTGRQVGALVHRSGVVDYVIVGDATKLMLPDLGRLRAASGRFRGLRLVHTHLRGEPLTRDDLVDLVRLRLDLVAAIQVENDGQPGSMQVAHLLPGTRGGDSIQQIGPLPFSRFSMDPAALVHALEQQLDRAARSGVETGKDGRAILVHVCDKSHAPAAQESLRELCDLARSAGVGVADTIVQVRDQIDPRFVLGRGKLDDVMLRAMQLDVEILILDRELDPRQANALSSHTGLKVLDRAQLILDIFAQRAESRDGKLQVELAQMKYLLPRLGQKDDALSRLTGGIGGRGPGETKLEIGKRRARERIAHLEEQLGSLARQRRLRRARRERGRAPVVAIVGYTNAGKSTLMHALTGADVRAEDRLFATLDTRSRRCWLQYEADGADAAASGGRAVVLTDTVGFIRDMPAHLFAAFRATFEETASADVLLHVVDAGEPSLERHLETTEMVLADLEIENTPRLLVLNKSDRLPPTEVAVLARRFDGVVVSATRPSTLGRLRRRLLALVDRHVAPEHEEPEPASFELTSEPA